jgi:DNA-directed RNA polymerase subunit E'/Rpb7
VKYFLRLLCEIEKGDSTREGMSVRMTNYKPVYLEQRVTLNPTEFRDAAGNMDEYLLEKMRKGLEGRCCIHGYVLPDSTQILSRSMGQAEHGHFTGDFLYQCKVKVMCLLPYADQILEGRILKMNKLGAYALLLDEGTLHEAIRILLPHDLHLGNTIFDGLQAGQDIRIRLLRSRFQTNDAFIQAVGVMESLKE